MVSILPIVTPVPQATPSALGFEVRCQRPLRFLRSGGGVEALEVVTAREPRQRPEAAPLADGMLAGDDQQVRGTLYQVDRGFDFWATDAGAFHIEPEGGYIEIPDSDDEVVREQRLWGTPAALCFMHRGDVPLHAAAVEVGGGAVVLAAPRRHGKTTLALAFHRFGYRILSEDLTCCRFSRGPELLPGPALLRIRPDVFDGHAPGGTHIVVARHDRVYVALDDDRRGSSGPIPIRAIVFLRESADDVRIERAAASAALADLWSLSFRLPNDGARARSFRQLTRLAGALPTWNLYRPLRLTSLEATVARIAEHFDHHR